MQTMNNKDIKSESQAEVYFEHSSIQEQDGLHLLSLLEKPVQGMKVLDLGCGTGQLSSVIAQNVGDTGSVVAIDPDETRIKLAKNKNGSIGNLSFQQGRADDIPGVNYDLVFSNYVFHWIEDKRNAFQNIRRCLKPGGFFAACFETKLSQFLFDYINLMEPPSKVIEVKNKLFFLSPQELENIASTYGFTLLHKSSTDRGYKFRNFSDFVGCIYGGFFGLVDTKFMNSKMLEGMKQSVIGENGEVEVEICSIIFYIFKLAA